jgi:hypothetical protein
MSNDEQYKARLRECMALLERTPAAPPWLATAVGAGIADARLFARRTPAEDSPSDFYYPH